MKWQLQETRALQVDFSSILPTDGYRLSLFGRGPIALHGLVHFLNTIGPSLTKVIYAYFDCISYVYVGINLNCSTLCRRVDPLEPGLLFGWPAVNPFFSKKSLTKRRDLVRSCR